MKKNDENHSLVFQKEDDFSAFDYKIYKIMKRGKECWRTHIYDEYSKEHRRLVQKNSREDLIEYLRELTLQGTVLSSATFKDIYKELLSSMMQSTFDKNTVRRYEQYFRRYYSDYSWINKPICMVEATDLENWAVREISNRNNIGRNIPQDGDNSLTKKEYLNMTVILRKVFKQARKKKIIKYSPVDNMDIDIPFRNESKPDADVATFSQDEMKKLLYYSNRDFEESGDIAALVPQVLYYGALREAEGLALHWSDLSKSMDTLKIWSQFKKCSYKKDDEPGWYTENEFVGHTKSAKRHRTDLGVRTIPVIPELKEVLVKIYGQKTIESDEIFIRNTGEHITSNMVKSKLFKYERWMGMSTVKSAHDLRRTAATFIKEAGGSDEQIKNILGHSDIKVTQNSYIYDQSNITDKSELIERALADHDKP